MFNNAVSLLLVTSVPHDGPVPCEEFDRSRLPCMFAQTQGLIKLLVPSIVWFHR